MPKLTPWWSHKSQQLTKVIPWETENVNTFQNDVIAKRVLRTRKVKLNPTKQQKMMLMKFADAARYSYNAAVSAVNDKTHNPNKIELQNDVFVSQKERWDIQQILSKTQVVVGMSSTNKTTSNL
ncbi:transposase [Paramecium bursaria Chlorella virus AN69C]|nr:transposase [Paramecium bursaria Chlorella virus AN69C]